MEKTPATTTFLDSVEHSFLSPAEKRALVDAAREGVTPQLWSEFNDKLIAAIVHTQERQRRYTRGLDDEINRFTAAYEKEKSVIDYALRDALAKVKADDVAERERLWDEYGTKIHALQARLLRDVRKTSTTVLHDVILAVVPGQAKE